MSKFTTPAVLEMLNDYRWRLVEPFEFWLTDSPEDVIHVPAGYVTDPPVYRAFSGQCSRHMVVTPKLPSFMTGCMRTGSGRKGRLTGFSGWNGRTGCAALAASDYVLRCTSLRAGQLRTVTSKDNVISRIHISGI